jgi:hypothetical protein
MVKLDNTLTVYISGLCRGGTRTFKVDRNLISTQTMEHSLPLTLPWDETFDIGADTGAPVDDKDHQVPFKFTGKIDKLTISVERPKLTAEDKKSSRRLKAQDAE